MFTNQYEEHIAHSAPCNSRWDGFDRGDDARADERDQGVRCIGRMTNEAGQRVEIIEAFDSSDLWHSVLVDGRQVFFEEDNRARAITVARWWMDGCPA